LIPAILLAGEGHAYPQAANAEDPRESYWVGGKEYIAAPWMARQAMEFQTAAQQLAEEDTIIQVHGHGLLPAIAKAMSEPPAGLCRKSRNIRPCGRPRFIGKLPPARLLPMLS
jgi:hypothetical protein